MVTKGENTAHEEVGAEEFGVGFAEKLKRSPLRIISKGFHEMGRILQVLRNNQRRIAISTVIVVLSLFVAYEYTMRTGVRDLVAHNATDTSMIGIELLCESGPNFRLAAEHHIFMLKKYTTHMENKYLGSIAGSILGTLHKEYTPAKGFEKALKTLEEALKESKHSSQEECARAIWLAGEQVEQYRMTAASFAKSKIVLHKYQKVPNELVRDITAALDNSKKSFARFLKNPTLENAVFLCEDNRCTMLLLFLARAGYNSSHEELVDIFHEFHQLEKELAAQEKQLFDRLPDDDPQMRKRFIGHIMQSEKRRLDVLELLKLGDVQHMHDARTLMWKTIEIAYHDREVILQFTKAVAFGEGKGWERPGS